MRISFIFLILFFDFILVFASPDEINYGYDYKFEKNKGQWPSQVIYRADMYSGRIFLEEKCFTYVYYNMKDLDKGHSCSDLENNKNHKKLDSASVRCHAFKVNFLGSSNLTKLRGSQKKNEYSNYFIGNDRRKWASNVEVFGEVQYQELYPLINLKVYSRHGHLKYDFILKPYADVNSIKLKYDGVKGISLLNGELVINTSVNEIIEQQPFAYQDINGQRNEVHCRYVLKNDIVSFEILSAYDKSIPLIIDPVIIASSYSGSLSTTYGGCATFDERGNIYSGATCFGTGYPITLGAFDVTFAGQKDISISKLNTTGSSLIYATYLGGDNCDFPLSLFVNSKNELCIYGITRSIDFPTSLGCYDNSFNGGLFDIVVTHLDSNGAALIGSTFIGGNDAEGNFDSLSLNTSKKSMGEIIVDSSGVIYVISTSKSSDFPITAGAHIYSSEQDAVIFLLNNDCSNMLWCSYIGGSGDDVGYGIRLSNSGEIIITGSTNSTDFPITPGAYKPSYQGGTNDGFICKLNSTNYSLIASTYYGTQADDKSMFVETDASDDIYILGQTTGVISITAGAYGVANSKNFIAKLSSGLSTLVYQTVIGNGGGVSGTFIVPTAFSIDICKNIYLSGYVPSSQNNAGYPTTPDALYDNFLSGQYYFAELSTNAAFLKYGTYFPGTHLDGGTSKFDKNGILYQAICARTQDPVPFISNSYCTSHVAPGNDIYVAKIDFQSTRAEANATVGPADSGCSPFQASFSSALSHGRNYSWNFGDGNTIDTSQNPLHTFTDTGNFHVRLIVFDSSACIPSDTFNLNIYVAAELTQQPNIDTILCATPSLILQAPNIGTNFSYSWNTNENSDFISVNTSGTYWVDISNGVCNARDSFFVEKLIPPDLGPDTILCVGQNIILTPQSNGNVYHWSTGDSISTIHITHENTYWVDVGRQDCILRDSIQVYFAQYPVVQLGRDTSFCPNIEPSVYLNAANPTSKVLWSTGDTTHTIIANASGIYWVTVANAQCSTSDSLIISTYQSKIIEQQDPYFCNYEEAWIDSKVSNVSYLWNTRDTTRKIHAIGPGEYWYQISYNGCIEGDTLAVGGPFADNMLWVPSAFTPNGDGKNDIFIPVGSDIQKFEMEIFNRWGTRIFQTSDVNFGWDGQLNGSIVQMGIYTYKIEYSTSCSDYPYIKTGCLLLGQ